MRISQLVFIIVISFCPSLMFAQYSTIINRDLPGNAISPHTIEAKILQVQMGLRYNATEFIIIPFGRNGSGNTINQMFTRNTVLRYGLQKRVELNAVLEWQSANLASLRINDTKWTQLGLRLNILEETKKKPGIGVDCQLLFPAFFEESYWAEDLGNSISLVVSKSIFESLGATFNLDFVWGDSDLPPPIKPASATFNLSYSVNNKIFVFVEASTKRNWGYTTYIQYNIGTSCLFGPNLQADLSTGWSRKEDSNSLGFIYVVDDFIDMRLSWRFDWDKSRRQKAKIKSENQID